MDTQENSPAPAIDELSALRAEKARRDGIANRIPAMIGYWNRELRCEFANDAYVEWFGLSPESVIGMHLRDLLGEDLFRLNEPYARLALSGQEQRFEREISKPDGSTGYTDARYIPDTDQSGNVRGFVVLVSDITDLHRAYANVRELAQRLESAREDERRSLAITLHEGIAQDLFAMKLRLEHLQAQATGRAGVTQACQELTHAISKCMTDISQIANDLRPGSLAHMRVTVAIAEHAQFFSKHTKLNIQVKETAPFPHLDEKLRLFLFRAAQEALTNVARHANASTVEISLHADATHIKLDVADDGIGMTAGDFEKPGSLGLLGMRERVQALGGDLSVTNNRAAGTTVSVQVPFP